MLCFIFIRAGTRFWRRSKPQPNALVSLERAASHAKLLEHSKDAWHGFLHILDVMLKNVPWLVIGPINLFLPHRLDTLSKLSPDLVDELGRVDDGNTLVGLVEHKLTLGLVEVGIGHVHVNIQV